MPGRSVRRHFLELSEFEGGLIIGMKTAGWLTIRSTGHVDRGVCRQKMLGAVDRRKYPRAENRVWSDQEDYEER